MPKLLIIDDEKENASYLEGFFKKRGCQVTLTFTGEDGLASFEKAIPDVVLLDLKLPGINGLEVLKRIRQKNKATPVVIFTGYGDEAIRKQAEELGANSYIERPFNMPQLEGITAKLIHK